MKLLNKRKCVKMTPPVHEAVFEEWTRMLPEMLVEIFGYLYVKDRIRVARVCRDWRAAVYVPGLWNKTVFSVKATRLTDVTISALVGRGVRHVKVCSDEMTPLGSGVDVRIGWLVAAVTNIEHLDVSDCKWPLTGHSLSKVIQTTGLRFLKHLNIAGQKSTTGVWLNAIAESCPNVEDLNLARCLTKKSDSLWPTALGRFAGLRRLNLSRCSGITTARIRALVASVPLLETLLLENNAQLTDEAVGVIASGLPRLTSLSIRHCCVGEWCNLTETTGEHLSRTSLRQLRSDCEMWTMAGLMNSGDVLLKSIRTLEIGGATTEELRLLTASAAGSNLVALIISSASAVTDEGLRHLSSIRTLKTLSLSECDQITAVGIGHLASGQLTQLETLVMEDCWDLKNWINTPHFGSSFTILCCRALLHSLRHVSLISSSITDAGIWKLVSGSPHLRWLCLSGCEYLSVKSIGYVATTLRDLEGFDLSAIGYGGRGVDKMRSRSNRVKKLLRLPRLRCVSTLGQQKNVRQLIASRRPDIAVLDIKQFVHQFKQNCNLY